VFVHVVSNGLNVASKVYEEFRHLCNHVRYDSLCTMNAENKLAFWAQLNQDAYTWAKAKLDVDRYLVIRAEDFVAGNEACISRVAKFMDLDFTDAELKEAAEAGKNSRDEIEGSTDYTLQETSVTAATMTMTMVKKQLEFWGYDI